ncbi:interleukin-17C-like isoform X2 [Acanthopagrus latus]|uniref:interleukin-17C-like isoform X2 n=1 Tax=Acanthopagrus latus TaxID=8177 RepID=UPI00187BDAE6|nr:interleukin-17C-like isoform X2 [Acanthopagrus latus]
MTRVSLQMLFLGSLLMLSDPTVPKCVTEDGLNKLVEEFQTKYLDKKVSVHQPDNRTCKQAAEEMQGAENNRSVSPWRYRLNEDVNRIPPTIPFAECICEGCIIDKQENMSYNSRAVHAWLRIHWKTGKCSNNKYKVKKDFIKVPVGCTCVVPNYTK